MYKHRGLVWQKLFCLPGHRNSLECFSKPKMQPFHFTCPPRDARRVEVSVWNKYVQMIQLAIVAQQKATVVKWRQSNLCLDMHVMVELSEIECVIHESALVGVSDGSYKKDFAIAAFSLA